MKARQLTSILLLAAMLASVSCGGDSGTSNDTTALADTSTAADDQNPLDFPQEDNNGKKFTMLVADQNNYEFLMEEQTGDVVDDAIFERNSRVEDYLGIELEVISKPGNWEDKENFNALIQNDVLANDQTYDLISAVTVVANPLSTEGIFKNLLDLEYLNLDNEWWVKGLSEGLTISNKLYCAFGDANLSMYKGFNVVFFNDELLNQYKLENPYDLVDNNEWTLDKFISMAKTVSEDLNSDSKFTLEDDRFGYVTQLVPHRSWQTATDTSICGRGDDGEYTLLPVSERMVDVSEKIYALTQEPAYYNKSDVTDFYDFPKYLAQDRALFLLSYLYSTESEHLRNMESDYGIVPYPKYDSAQDRYYTQIATATSVFFVPITVKDEALTAKVMEAISCFSKEKVIDAYYETALKEKYARDERVGEMLEIIRDSAYLDFNSVFSTMFEPFINCVIVDSKGIIASYYESNRSAWEAKFESIVEAYANNE